MSPRADIKPYVAYMDVGMSRWHGCQGATNSGVYSLQPYVAHMGRF
jgi:hypothetical protein